MELLQHLPVMIGQYFMGYQDKKIKGQIRWSYQFCPISMLFTRWNYFSIWQ
ncbi:unnamed protein product [Paramecium sonneborni]|uniref:Uncharacterized protein n=1 Tax=Paramecium sonneborni TaxID=65129 RepID=A0A8S1RKL7_9CILI|nr:unnamed protein product [Paramecium sonneborni]